MSLEPTGLTISSSISVSGACHCAGGGLCSGPDFPQNAVGTPTKCVFSQPSYTANEGRRPHGFVPPLTKTALTPEKETEGLFRLFACNASAREGSLVGRSHSGVIGECRRIANCYPKRFSATFHPLGQRSAKYRY